MNRWESVSAIQFYCNELSFSYMYDLLRWKFMLNSCTYAPVAHLSAVSKFDHDVGEVLANKYKDEGLSDRLRRHALTDQFRVAVCGI
jgi:hypothetical protein